MGKILFATTNKNKVKRLINFIGKSDYEFLTLNSLDYEITEPLETSTTPVEIAKEKAQYYFNHLISKIPVISQDDTIYININGIDKELLSIKAPVEVKYGKFTDSNAINYYSNLAKENGGEIEMQIRYGFAYANNDYVIGEPAILKGKLVSQISNILQTGYFLTSIFKVKIDSGEYKYMSEMNNEQNAFADKDLRRAVLKLLNSNY